MSKMTNINALTYVLEHSDNLPEDVIERVNAMLTTLTKRASSDKTRERKPTAKDIARNAEMEELRKTVVSILSAEPNRLFACKELAEIVGVSTPKMTAVLTSLRKAERVLRSENKGKDIRWQAKGE